MAKRDPEIDTNRHNKNIFFNIILLLFELINSIRNNYVFIREINNRDVRLLS